MEREAAELRARLAGVGVRQTEIVKRTGYGQSAVSEFLAGKRRMPQGFAEQVQTLIEERAREMADEERATADAKARALLEAAGITEKDPALQAA